MDSTVLQVLDPQFNSQFLSKARNFRASSMHSSRPVHLKSKVRGFSSNYQEEPASERKRPISGSHKKRCNSFGLAMNSAAGRQHSLHFDLLRNGKKRQTGYQPSRGDMLELKELIEQSFRRPGTSGKKPSHRIPSPLLKGKIEFPTQESTDDPSLKDTLDCEILNSELHYIENLAKAGDASERDTLNITGDCPLKAIRSFEQQRPRRHPLPLHQMLLPSPGERLVTDPSELFLGSPKPSTPQTHRRLPSAIYKFRRKGKVLKNEDCLKVTKVVCPWEVEKAKSISEGDGRHSKSIREKRIFRRVDANWSETN